MSFILFLLTVCMFAIASASDFEVYQNKTFLTIKKEKGFFKILQFADIHYANGINSTCKDILPEWAVYPCSDLNSTDWEDFLVRREQPDLVIFTGDNIMGYDTFNHRKSVEAILAPLKKHKIPHMTVFGNHDDEINQTPGKTNMRYEIMKIDMESPYSLSKVGSEDVHGVGNYAYGILDSEGKQTHTLYLMDSSSYDITGNIGGYDWMRPNQINWYNETSFRQSQKLNKTLPAILFHHIPTPEYEMAWHCNKGTESKPITYTGFNTDKLPDGYASMSGVGLFATFTSCRPDKTVDKCIGVKQEGVYSSFPNPGLFSTLIDRNEIKMINVGHDHLNDYCCPFGNTAIQYCFGGGFGYHAYGKKGWPRRSRVINLYPDGKIDTYHRLDKFSTPPYKRTQGRVIYDPSVKA